MMQKPRNMFANGACHWSARAGSYACMLALHVILALGYTLGLSGCSAQSADPKTGDSPRGIPSSEGPVKGQMKSQSLENQPFRVQELLAREEHGQTILAIKFSQPVNRFRHFVLAQPTRIVLDVFGDTQRLTQVESFRIDTGWVSTLGLSSSEGNLRLTSEITAESAPAYIVTPDDGGLKVVIGAADQKAAAKKDVVLMRGAKRADAKPVAVSVSESKPQLASVAEPEGIEKTYNGQKISLDFKDADIKNVFRLLAEVSGLNMIVTPDVSRKVTIRLVEVPWDQALELLVDTNGLIKEQVGNVVRISTAGALKAENDALTAARRSREEREPLHTTYFNLNYAKARDLEPRVKLLMTKRLDAALVIDERSNTIMVRDVKKSVDDVSTLIGKLDTRTPQVLIESNLIETTPTFSRALGFQLGFDRGGFRFDSNAPAGPPFTGTLGATLSVIQNRVGGLTDLVASLTAAEQEGRIKIISRPSVLTLNNIPSTIQSLRILRVVLPSSTNIASGTGAAAGTAVATERIPVGITLTVTPQVSSDGFVLMNISVKSSSLGSQSPGSVIPDELSREAISNVLVRDGETIVIGGIIKDTSQEAESGVPYLKDIPVLGWAFKNMRWQKDFEELMVFITPRIMIAGSENLPAAEQLWREQLKKTDGHQTFYQPPAP
jgi:type II secretory pathway component GspD/PulD (secretin)